MNSHARVTPSARLSLSDHPRLISAVLALFLAAMCFQLPAMAGNFNVSDAAGLRAALLTAATNGEDDVIVLAAGTYATGGTTFTFLSNESNTLTLQGASGTTRDQLVLDGGGNSQVLHFGCVGSCGAITLRGLIVQNSQAVTASQSLILSDVNFSGSGVIAGSTLTVTDSTFSNGGVSAGSTVTVTNSTFTDYTGGAITGNPVTVTNSTFNNNTSSFGGAAINAIGEVTVTNSSFNNNTSNFGGGSPSYGGGAITGNPVTVTHSSFRHNTSSGNGGAINSAGSVTVTDSIFSDNIGGTIWWAGDGPDFCRGYGGAGGGGAISGGAVIVTKSFFINNATNSKSYGGAIYGHVSVNASSFTNNTANGGNGGAIYGSGTITNSVFNNNTATLNDPTPYCGANRFPLNGRGGAIISSSSPLIVSNNTFSGNSAGDSGAAINMSSTASIINSIFYGHTTPAIYALSAYNLYNNLIDTSTGIAGSTPIMVGNVAPGATSPFVDAANDNFRLAAGSLAINAGLDPNSTTFANLVGSSVTDIRQALLTDLQGSLRPAPGTAVDIGAYEFRSEYEPPTVPTGLSATAVSASQINLAWTASTDNVGVTAYKVYRDGSLIATLGNVTSDSDTGLTASTTYTYTVQACDAVGNCSAQSASVSVTTQPLPMPLCTLTASPSSILAGSTSTLTASCSPPATSYVWSTNTGFGSTVRIGTVSPTVTTTYTVAGTNSTGSSAAASVTVTVTPAGTPVCTLTASPASIAAGGTSTLTASCSLVPMSYIWTGGTCSGATGASCTVTPAVTTTYTVAGINSAGTGAVANATVTLTNAVTPFDLMPILNLLLDE